MLITKDLHFVDWNLVFLEYQRFRGADFPIKVSLPYHICETRSLSPASQTSKQNKTLTYGPIFHLNNTLFYFKTYCCLSKCDDTSRIQICGFTLVCKLQVVPSYFVFQGPHSSEEVLTTEVQGKWYLLPRLQLSMVGKGRTQRSSKDVYFVPLQS